MKPHIRMINGRWFCTGNGIEKYAGSPVNAWRRWQWIMRVRGIR